MKVPRKERLVLSEDECEAPSVLIVEDDEQQIAILTRILEAAGWEVIGAIRSTDALRIALEMKTPPNLIVSDNQITGGTAISGLTRAREQWPDTAIVLVTGDLHASLRLRAEACGVDEMVKKPYLAAEITAAIFRACKRRRSAQSSSSGETTVTAT